MNLNYIQASEIIKEVKNELSPYFEKGSLDESYVYPPIKECLAKMGVRILPVNTDVIKVEDFKVDLPCDFYKLVFAVACGAEEFVELDYLNTKLEEYTVDSPTAIDVCSTRCDYCEDACGNLYGIRQYFNTYAVEFKSLYPLKLTTDARPYCTEECFKYQQRGNEITIKNGKIYTGFEKGTLYIEYLTNLDEDNELMIPDDERIKNWIKHEIMFVLFRKLYLNGEGDVQQRLQWVQQQLSILQTNAQTLYKRFTTKEFYDLRRTLYSRFHKFNTAVYGKYYNSQLSQYKKRTPYQDYTFDRFT